MAHVLVSCWLRKVDGLSGIACATFGLLCETCVPLSVDKSSHCRLFLIHGSKPCPSTQKARTPKGASCGLPTKVFEVAISVTPSLVRVLVTCSYVKDKEPILVGFYATPFGFGAIGFNIAAILDCPYNWFFENDLFLPVLAHSIYLVYSIHNFDWLCVNLKRNAYTQKARSCEGASCGITWTPAWLSVGS